MSSWFRDRRQEYIAARLKRRGKVAAEDVAGHFDIHRATASADLAVYVATHPLAARYDASEKAFVRLGAAR